MRWFVLFLLLLPACRNDGLESADGGGLPGGPGEIRSVPANDNGRELRLAIEEGLTTRGKGADQWRFVLIRAIDRHDPRLPETGFHFVVGAGVALDEGAIRVRRIWSSSGQFDGNNEQMERSGVAIGIERGARRPYSEKVVDTVRRICEALAERIDLHPDCVVAIEEAPFAKRSEFDAAERLVSAVARSSVPLPAVDGTLTVGGHVVEFEERSTTAGREIGMMLRKQFEGENRGMLFIYPHRSQRGYWMRNCFIPMDLAYIANGRVEQIETMAAQPGVVTADLRRYESITPVRFVLEMSAGWFARNGVKVGDPVIGLPK